MTPRIENAVIDQVSLGTEDSGIFTCLLYIRGDGITGFGGYALDSYDQKLERRRGTAYGLEFIMQILRTLEVGNWEKLPGTPIRIETTGIGGRITRIGHFLKDRWFDPETVSKEEA